MNFGCQNENNDDSQIPETSRIDSSEPSSASDKSISEYNKKRKKTKAKKSVSRPEDPVNNKYIKLEARDKHGHKKIEVETKNQSKITDKFQSTHIDSSQEKLINKALTRFFTCCGIPFWVVKSPFFIDLLKNLNVGYTSPDRRTLSNLWVDQETTQITINIDEHWTSESHHSYYAFVIITPDRYQYVHSVQDFSSYSHTGRFLSNEIIKIIDEIGPEKFGVVVSDGATAMQLAKNLVAQKYLHIILIHCIAHHVQLIVSDIIKKTLFGFQVLSKCQEFITYFQNLHVSSAQLRDKIKNFLIKSGGLKSSHEFWANVECLHKVLEPAKIVVKTVESSNIKFADVFLILIKMANMIKTMLIVDTTLERLEFRKK
ncbi:3817_t:CDS:2, partial [Dentiscutata erythropus]